MLGFQQIKSIFTQVNSRTIYLLSIGIGVLSGLGALALHYGLHYANDFTFTHLAQIDLMNPEAPDTWRKGLFIFFMPVFGGLAAGWLVRYFAPEAKGTGTEAFINAFHNKSGFMRGRIPFVKSLATIITISSGGSAGVEGPVAQIGAGIGSHFSRFIKMGARARRTLLLAGAAGGLGAIFKAPLAGALTAVEVLYKEDIETDALTPCILSSVTAYTIYCSVAGFKPLLHFEVDSFHRPSELLFYLVLGLCCSLLGAFYVKFFHGVQTHFFDKLPISPYILPAVGGVMVGTIGLFYPQVLGQGAGIIIQALQNNFHHNWIEALKLFSILAVLKIFATSFTIGSGMSGGVFAPSLFIGAMMGGAVGTICHQFFPSFAPDLGPFVLVGMAAFFAGVANAPIASILMVCELTGAYELLPPLLMVAMIALIFTHKWSIYKNQVLNKFHSKAHLWEMNPDVLKERPVMESMTRELHERAIILNNTPLSKIEKLSHDLHDNDFIVKDSQGSLLGMIALQDIHDEEDLDDLAPFLLADDLINRKPFSIHPEDKLITAIEMFLNFEVDKIPVVKENKLLGYLRYRDILRIYQNVKQRKAR